MRPADLFGFVLALSIGCGPSIDVADEAPGDGDGSSDTSASGGSNPSASGPSGGDPDPSAPPPDPDPDPEPEPIPDPNEFKGFWFQEADGVELVLTNTPTSSCDNKFGDYECLPYAQWMLSIQIPEELLVPGEYLLGDFEGSFSQIDAGAGPDECGGSGGGGPMLFIDGILVIESVGDTIDGLLIEAGVSFGGPSVTGPFSADRCAP